MVFVIQNDPAKNISCAEKYGEVVSLLPHGSNITFSAGAITQRLRSLLSNFCDADYLLLIGDPVAIGIAVAVACSWNRGRAKLLKWDRQEHIYYPVSVDIYLKKGEDSDKFPD
jgi:hypothetical protein